MFNNRLDGWVNHLLYGGRGGSGTAPIKTALAALKEPKPTAKETPVSQCRKMLRRFVAQAKGAH
ncbi:hypothetical protein ACLK19_04105 [Escherichia coli]